MSARTDAEIADRLAKRRAWTCVVLAFVFFAAQAASIELTPDDPLPPLYSEGFYFWVATLVLVLVLATGLLRGPAVRAMLNDESTMDHRRRALAAGFWGALAMSTLLWATSEPVTGGEAARLIETIAVS